MKKSLLVILFFVVVDNCFAQQNFEGKIVYLMHKTTEADNDAELTILFGKNKMKASIVEKGNKRFPKKSYSIIDLTAGEFITINAEDSTFSTKKFKEKSSFIPPVKKEILGHNVSTIVSTPSILDGSYMGQTNTALYVSDSLWYAIPEKYGNNIELMMIKNNRIVLGVTLSLYGGPYSDDSLINIEAQQVIPMKVLDSEFDIPPAYIARSEKSYNDSVTVVLPPPPPPAKKKLPAQKTIQPKASPVMRKP